MRLATSAALAIALLAACGSGDESIGTRPRAVAPELAPPEIGSGLKLFESTTDETIDAFSNAGDRTIVVDGKLWEIRKGARLVGALQISTVKDKVDLGVAHNRDAIVREILVGTADRIRVGEVEIYTSAANDKVVYLWFGEGMFEVLQLKGDELDHERLLADVIEHQHGLAAWRPLVSDVEAEVAE